LSLDSVALLAGTTYRGQYEERLRALVAETSAAGDVLLFVDEMHNLIGQGSASGSAMDAANMLKPALARGEFRMLGATTDEEYERWILGDPALERRFQKIAVRELSPAETLEILRTRIPSLALHHHVVITDAAIRAAIELTDIWVPDRRRPDKAIDALDEACAHTQATAAYSPGWSSSSRSGVLGCVVRRALRRVHGDRATHSSIASRATASPCSSDSARRSRPRSRSRSPSRPSPMRDLSPRRRPPRALRSPPPGAERAALDIELERQLLDEGIVVRGHDVARVVGLMVGRRVEWEE
jgi:ATP-dependent Clp protease ATP-binding subunit ClpA